MLLFFQHLENVLGKNNEPNTSLPVTQKEINITSFCSKRYFSRSRFSEAIGSLIFFLLFFSSSNPGGKYVHWKNINCIKVRQRNTNNAYLMLQSTGETVTNRDNWPPQEFSKEKQWLPLVQGLWSSASSVCWLEWEAALENKSLHGPSCSGQTFSRAMLGITEVSITVHDFRTANRLKTIREACVVFCLCDCLVCLFEDPCNDLCRWWSFRSK